MQFYKPTKTPSPPNNEAQKENSNFPKQLTYRVKIYYFVGTIQNLALS